MKRSIRHLPKGKQDGLKEIVSFITGQIKAHMIILFGSYARGDWVEDRYIENGTTYEYKSDYDLLVVVDSEEKAIHNKPAKSLRRKTQRSVDVNTPINLTYHGINRYVIYSVSLCKASEISVATPFCFRQLA